MITTPATLIHKYDSPSALVSLVIFQAETTFMFSEGQFVMVEAEINGKLTKRPYSIATTNQQLQETKQLGIIVKKTSDEGMSDRLTQKIKLGDTMILKWPAGHYTDPHVHRNYLLISTGSGLSPNFWIFQHLITVPTQYDRIIHMFGERFVSELIPQVQGLFVATSSDRIKHFLYLSQEPDLPMGYRKGYIQEGLPEALAFLGTETTCFVCGNPTMVTDIVHRLTEAGIPREQIVVEKY